MPNRFTAPNKIGFASGFVIISPIESTPRWPAARSGRMVERLGQPGAPGKSETWEARERRVPGADDVVAMRHVHRVVVLGPRALGDLGLDDEIRQARRDPEHREPPGRAGEVRVRIVGRSIVAEVATRPHALLP